MINIICGIDNNYTRFCGVFMTSVLENNKGENICFYIINNGLTEKNKELLTSIINKYNSHIKFGTVNNEHIKYCPIKKGDYVSIAAYFRILTPLIFPEIEKAIYFDVDIIVNGDITGLWEINIENFAIGAVREGENDDIRLYNIIDYNKEKGLFNSGVLLMNLKYWREKHVTERTMEFIKNFPEKCYAWDQGALNNVLQDEKLFLPLKYNFTSTYFDELTRIHLDKKYWDEVNLTKQSPVVIHYTCTKPWYKECQHPLKSLFYKYQELTPWKKSKPRYQYNKLSSKVKRMLQSLNLMHRETKI